MINEKKIKLGKQSSAIRELFEYGKIRKQEIGNDKVFDFSIGNPNVPCPQIVTDKLIELITSEDPVLLHEYSSAVGYLEVRNAVADYLNKKYETKEEGKYVLITAGAAPGLSITFNGLLNDGEEVVVIAPFWPEYRVFVENARGVLTIANSDKQTFLPDFKDLENKINENTKMIVINSPNNPTGVVYSEETIKELASLLNKKQLEYGHDIYLVSDEPYRELVYEDIKYPFITNYYNNSIVIYSFSKSLSLPGERIGYVLVGRDVNNKDDVFMALKGSARTLGYVCASTLFQRLLPVCHGYTSDLNVYKENQDILYNHLKNLGFEVTPSQGAFYLFVKALEKDAQKFSDVAKEKFELLLVPSDSFGVEGYVRISYCVSQQQIINSLPAFEKLFNYYKNLK